MEFPFIWYIGENAGAANQLRHYIRVKYIKNSYAILFYMRFFSRLQIFYPFVFLPAVVFGIFALPFGVSSQSLTFTRSLSVGSGGADVSVLQKIFNTDIDTVVALSGPGSPGLETNWFGALTRTAVMKFQKKYAADILAQGQAPTGFVGPKTLKKLNALATALQTTAGSPSSMPRQNAVPPAVSNSVSNAQPPAVAVKSVYLSPAVSALVKTVPATNPNSVNLDKFLSAVESVGKKQGMSDAKLNVAANGIAKAAAGPMDFRKEFADALAKARVSSELRGLSPRPIALGNFFKNLLTSLGIIPSPVEALSGIPFGGAVLYVFFCDCSANWLITVEPMLPTYVSLLSYYTGTQAFRNYNTPFTTELVGSYNPPGICDTEPEADCAVVIPSEGLIMPTLGSSI